MAQRTCSVDGCDLPVSARGWCLKHYKAWHRSGSPLGRPPVIRSAVERVLSRIIIDPDDPLGCWVWPGQRSHGYGRIRSDVEDGSRQRPTHCVVYEALVGPIPDGLELDHFICDNPPCCNPDHLRPVSRRENALRSSGLGAANLAKTHCTNGHPFDQANTRIDPRTGDRACRACARENTRRYLRKHYG